MVPFSAGSQALPYQSEPLSLVLGRYKPAVPQQNPDLRGSLVVAFAFHGDASLFCFDAFVKQVIPFSVRTDESRSCPYCTFRCTGILLKQEEISFQCRTGEDQLREETMRDWFSR